MIESHTHIAGVRISPKKLRFLIVEIKKMEPEAALDMLLYSPKRGARILYKALKSAFSNAANTLKKDARMVQFKTFSIDEGPRLKRYKMGGRGTAKPFRRKLAYINIVLVPKEEKAEKKGKK